MIGQRYDVLMGDIRVAENLTLDIAMVLVEALFKKYYKEASVCGMTISIKAIAQEE